MSVIVDPSYLQSEETVARKHRRPNSPSTSNNATDILSKTNLCHNEICDMARRVRRSQCVEDTSTLFHVYGYTIIMDNLPNFYSGSRLIKDWYEDVYRFVELSYIGRELAAEENQLVKAVELIATSKYGGLTNQQWRCLLCLAMRVNKHYDSGK